LDLEKKDEGNRMKEGKEAIIYLDRVNLKEEWGKYANGKGELIYNRIN